MLTRGRRRCTWLAFAAAALLAAGDASAHAKLRASSPADGAQLVEVPREIRLSFTEAIEPALSSVRIVDAAGARSRTAHARSVPGDTQSCVAAFDGLQPGAYLVEWRVVSVDGHPVSGSYRFEIRLPDRPAAVSVPRPSPASPPAPALPRASRREMAARWIFMVGVAALLGASVASAGGFGGDSDIALAGGGWLVAGAGVLLLLDAQRRNAGTSTADLLPTAIGGALIWRGAALAVAGLLLAIAYVARRAPRPAVKSAAMLAVAICGLGAIAVHAAAGHAGAREQYAAAAIGVQWVHLAAGAIWVGGLAALLVGTRGEAGELKATAVRRYSWLAGMCLVVVAGTGLLRTVQEVPSWNALVGTDYGQAALAKGALLAAIAAVGALNRFRSVPVASTDLRPLRRFAAVELVLMVIILAAAAVLATLPPPR